MVRLSKEAEKIALNMFQESNGVKYEGFRLKAKIAGCSMNYEMTIAEGKKPGEAVVDQGSLKLFMDIDSFHLLTGAVIEYINQGSREGFMIIQKTSTCRACKVSNLSNCS